MARPVKVAVIGAGVSGLVAARELQREGHRVVVFEKNHRIGGTWAYDPRTESDPLGVDPNREIIHSSLYLCMRTNLPRQLMGCLDYPFVKRETGDQRTFPGHEEVLRFLDGFAEEFGIHELTRFESEVARVALAGEGKEDGWSVEWRRRGSESLTRETFEAVVVCSGHSTVPKLAEIPGIENWRRYQMHSHNYRVPDPFKGQVVVMIGLGPSGFDISKDIGKVATEVHIAVRMNPMLKNVVKLQDFQNISHHSTIKSVYEDGLVAFEDGSSVYADSIIHCTGYKYHIPFLETKGIVNVEDDRVGPLYKHVFPPSLAPSLSFVGLTSHDPAFHIFELQSKWVAKVLSGKVALPSTQEMMDSVQNFYEFLEQNQISKHHTHFLRPHQVDYKYWLAEESGFGALEEWREEMFSEIIKKFLEMQRFYIDHWDDAYWDSIIRSSSSS
ncbi:flavin-containing monooxygenase FMO GS-OX-like 2 [Neltuma alba]|uniref:flavin-containing monooxygenase FMO GS-OX-like 2 n=1 Tax=Neltuma alba TaxID=207710 RepID=UPI0010A51E01|nr:flavin-containing monooxygenase FMO GS-OX-like 2 [Prosopis alba]